MKSIAIHLGYEVGSGGAVAVPLAHMAITGITQAAGKTTALEALISRAGKKALAFVTKRGEKAFEGGRTILPYFRKDEAGWQFVEDLIEAALQEKNKFQRAWVQKACRGAASLKDVHANAKRLMGKATREMDKDQFMLLDSYFDIILPQIDSLPAASAVDLAPGLNVMDLRDFALEMQMLVVRSSIEWIWKHEEQVVTIIPEAWKFCPDGKGSPVKAMAENLTREGAALGNFVWTDSQDMAAVAKFLQRASTVWLVGVQREHNELKRTLANIPAGIKKPKAEDVASLGLGQFYACWGTHAVKTYVQPAWMSGVDALMIAQGKISVEDLGRRREGETGRQGDKGTGRQRTRPAERVDHSALSTQHSAHGKEDHMSKEDVEHLEKSIGQKLDGLMKPMAKVGENLDRLLALLEKSLHPLNTERLPLPPSNGTPAPAAGTLTDELWAAIRERAMAEKPEILRVLTAAREIVVEEVSKVSEVSDDTPKGKFARLIADGFLDEVRDAKTLFAELQRRGGSWAAPTVSNFARSFAAAGFLTVEGSAGYRIAPGVKVHKRHLEVAS